MEHKQVISRVDADSIAEELGLEAGDALAAINGQPVLDVIDYLSLSAEEQLELTVCPKDGGEPVTVQLEKDSWEPLGLNFDRPMMDTMRMCRNKCVFCFVDQLPKGVRPSMKLKDDDWRMSLMMGNYVTLTNVDEEELARICARKVSPLYLSVHAVDHELRKKLLGNPDAPDICMQMQRLQQAGIRFHTQIVLCPGWNDGEALTQSLETLYAMPGCLSAAVVPVGLTRYGNPLLRPVTAEDAEDAIHRVQAVQQKARGGDRELFAYASDEMYIRAGLELPPAEDYGDYPQIDNGVGLWRAFEEEFLFALEDAPDARAGRVCIACGKDIAPLMAGTVAKLPGEVRVAGLDNRFFGPSVTVSGLVTGLELKQLQLQPGERLLIPATMLREGHNVFLDGTTLEQLAETLGVHPEAIPVNGGALFEVLTKEELQA